MRLLIAEDEKSLSRALAAILTRNNYSVDTVYDGEAALEYLEATNYDGLILDVMMPKMDGITVLKTLRARGNTIPVLILSAKSEIDDAFYGDGKDAFEGVDNLLKNDVVKEGDVVCINVDYKQIINNEGAFGNIINNNNGTQVIINVLITDEDVTEINIFKGFTANTNVSTEFYKYSSYVVWNFGDYNGDINIKEEMVGIIVAPKGRVY